MQYRILHIEDSKTDADLVKRVIERAGLNFTYKLASDKKEVLEALNLFEPNVILCDHSLPAFNSKMAYSLCKEKNTGMPFILVTGAVSEEFAVEMLHLGVDDYLLKSSLQRLPSAIANVVAKKDTEKKIRAFRTELNRSETHLRTIFENSSVGLLLLDRNYIILKLNDRTKFYNLISFGRELVQNENLLESIPAFRREDLKVQLDRSLRGQKIQYESVYPRVDGSIITFEVKLSPTIDGAGVITGTCMSFEDISERKKAEEEIKINERRLDVIYNTVSDSIFMLSVEKKDRFRFISVNSTFLQTTALPPERVVGQYVDEVIPSPSLELVVQKYKEAITERSSVSWEEISVYPAGEKTGLVTVSPVIDENNRCTMLVGTVHDITERKKANDEMKSLTNRLLLATTSAGMGVWDWDIKNDNLLWDEGMYRLYKIENGHFGSVYNEWISRIHPEDRDGINEDIQMALKGEKVYDTEFRIIADDESVHYIKATGLTETDPDGNTIRLIGVNWDITEIKLAEIRLNEVNANLQKHVKDLALSNAELEQFAYVASHDLQEPLRMITGFLTQLEKKYGASLDDKAKKYIDFAVDGAKRMRQIILDLLQFSIAGNKEDEPEVLDLNKLLHEIKILLRKKIDEKKALIIFDALPVIHNYRSPLRQVFQNLISNSLKYSDKEVAPAIRITAKEEVDHWAFAVIDNGIGIEKEYFDRIFLIFQRLHNKDEYAGTGMGLAVTKKIIESMGGQIWVESEAGKGSSFFFTLKK